MLTVFRRRMMNPLRRKQILIFVIFKTSDCTYWVDSLEWWISSYKFMCDVSGVASAIATTICYIWKCSSFCILLPLSVASLPLRITLAHKMPHSANSRTKPTFAMSRMDRMRYSVRAAQRYFPTVSWWRRPNVLQVYRTWIKFVWLPEVFRWPIQPLTAHCTHSTNFEFIRISMQPKWTMTSPFCVCAAKSRSCRLQFGRWACQQLT